MLLIFCVIFQLFFFCCNLYCQYLTLSASAYYIVNYSNIQYTKTTLMHASLKQIQQQTIAGSVLQISRFNNIINFYDGNQDMVEVDVKHRIILKTKLKFPPLSVKCFSWEGSNNYFITTIDKIENLKTGMISQSNSKAEFTGVIDCLGQGLLFMKFHHNYKKYSINYLWQGNKSIVKLTDQPVKKLIFNPSNSQVIYSIKDIVSSFDLNQPQKESIIFKKSTFLHDSNNLYYLHHNLQNKSKGEYECGIFDFRTGRNTDSWISKDIPIKVDCFGRILTVATANAIEIYDTRKLIKSAVKEDIPRIKDFYYEPNLSRLYVGCENKLKIYSTQY